MKMMVRNGFLALALATITVACGDNAKNDNVDGLVDSTAITEPTMDEAMNTPPDTATVVRTDSTAMQEMNQTAGEAKEAVQ